MKALDFTKKKSELVDKLVKLGFHYLSTDKEEPDGLRNPPRLITTWANVMNGVTLQIIDTYDELRGENYELITTPLKQVIITDDCTNASVTMSVEEFMIFWRGYPTSCGWGGIAFLFSLVCYNYSSY